VTIVMRDYQEEAIGRILEELEEKNSTLVVKPTGTGKTRTFAELARRHLAGTNFGQVLVIVRGKELVRQAHAALVESLGCEVGIEMADETCLTGLNLPKPRAIVSSIDSLGTVRFGSRRSRQFEPTLVIYDEADQAVCDSGIRAIRDLRERSPGLKLVGFTATPNRSDEESLGQMFESVAYQMPISEAIEKGWLVRIRAKAVWCKSLDLSKVKTNAGDLAKGELAAAIEKDGVLFEMVLPMLERVGSDLRTIVYCASVKQAEDVRDLINARRSIMPHGEAVLVTAKTPEDERAESLRRFGAGEVQFLVNVGIATRGWDDPCTDRLGVRCIAMMRPTKSKSLVTQCVGRGLRPIPGTVAGLDDAGDRVAAIAGSAKPSCLLLDFVGNVGRHALATAADILGGMVTPRELDATRIRPGEVLPEVDVVEAIAEEERRIKAEREAQDEARRRKRLAKVRNAVGALWGERDIDPFRRLGIDPKPVPKWYVGRPATENQKRLLDKYGLKYPPNIGFGHAMQLLDAATTKPTPKQCWKLKSLGLSPEGLDFKGAIAAIDKAEARAMSR
jgi:superfamily II DNA or RNA helicase